MFVAIGIWLSIKIPEAVKKSKEAWHEDLPLTYTITNEDSNLIAPKYQKDLHVIEVRNSKVRHSIPILLFDKKYDLFTYKIDMTGDYTMQSIFSVNNESVGVTPQYVYSEIGIGGVYILKCIAGAPKIADKIYLTYTGKSFQTVASNDSILSYHLQCKNFSVRYGKDDPIDMVLIGFEGPLTITNTIPMDILFLKRGKSMYMLVLTPKEENGSIAPDLLYNIVTGK